MSESESTLLTERIGLIGVLALVIGNAISIPIFVLPGPLTAQAGPSVVLATLLAAVPASFVVLYNAQLGSAMPVAGGLYVYISRLTAPFWGFLVPFTLPIVNWAGLLFTAIGFAEYVRYFVDVPANLLIYGFLIGVLIINLVGIKTVARAQILFVVVLFASILVFVIPGLFAVEPANYAEPFPNGVGPFGLAVVALYYPYLGFGLLTEIGEEIDDPGRIIPLALFTGVTVVALVYLAMVTVVAGVLPYEAYEGTEAGVAVAAAEFLPSWLVAFVAAGALFAVATSVNTSLLVSSRTVMRAGRDGVLPGALSRIHPRFGTPYVSILVLGVPPLLLATVIQEEVVELSVFIALAVLTAMFFSAIALWNLPVEFPAHYRNAALKLERYRGLVVAVVGGALVSALLWVVTLIQLPIAGLLLFGWFFVGYLYYRYRVEIDDRPGGGLYMKMVSLEAHEDAFAQTQSYDTIVEDDSPAEGD